MKKINEEKAQALVETAIILLLLLILVLGIAEFARAWFIKNSIKNAARQGARTAAVMPAASLAIGTTSYTCPDPRECPNSNLLINAVCCQPGVPANANFSVIITDDNASGTINSGDTVKVVDSTTITFVVGNSPWPWSKTATVYSDASMRYE